MKAAYITLLTKEAYLAGTLVLNHSLRSVGSKYELIVMVTPELSPQARDVLSKVGIKMRDISRLDPAIGRHTLANHDLRFTDTWTKLRAFELVEYDVTWSNNALKNKMITGEFIQRVVQLDSDMLILRNMDDLLEYELPGPDWIAACHACTCNPRKLSHYPADWTPENCAYTPLSSENGTFPPPLSIILTSPRTHLLLNSGTVLLHPSETLSLQILNFLETSPLVSKFSFPDQDLLAEFFKGRFRPLPYVYNALKTLRNIHTPLWRDEDVKCLHYILADKPWTRPRGSGEDYETVNGWWWDRYDEVVARLKEIYPNGLELVAAQVVKG